MSRTKVSLDEMLSAVVAAYRVNGDQIVKVPNEDKKISNKTIILSLLAGQECSAEITEQDRLQAQTIRSYMVQRHMLSQLTGKPLGEFVDQIASYLNTDTVPAWSAGILAWAPKVYQSLLVQDGVNQEFSLLSTTSSYIGKLGDKLELDFTVVSKRWSQAYNCWRYAGHDGRGNLVGFLNKKELSQGSVKIKGRVKAQEVAKSTGGKTTFLNYVKELQ